MPPDILLSPRRFGVEQRGNVDRLEKGCVPASPVLDVNKMHNDEQALARDMVVDIDHATEGTVKTLGLPDKFSHTPGKVVHGAPLYGEHTRSVLTEHGYVADQVDDLLKTGVVIAR